MVKLDAITQEVLDKISEGFGQSGAFNLRQNGISCLFWMNHLMHWIHPE